MYISLGKLEPNTVNREIFVYENIHVLNVRVNKFSWVPHENILTRKFFQLHIIEITVHAFPIVTSYLAIATYLFTCAAEICISPIRLHTDSFENTV